MMQALRNRDCKAIIVTTLTSDHDDAGRMDLEIVSQEQSVQMLYLGMFPSSFLAFWFLAIVDEPHQLRMDTIVLLKTSPCLQLKERDLAGVLCVDVDHVSVDHRPHVVANVLFFFDKFANLTLPFAVRRRVARSMVN